MLARLARWLRYATPIALACAYPVLSAWTVNRAELPATLLLRPLLTTFGVGFLLCLMLLPFTKRSGARLGVTAALILLLLFSFDIATHYVAPSLRMGIAYSNVAIDASWDYAISLVLLALALLSALLFGLRFGSQQRVEQLLSGVTIFTAVQLAFCLPALRQSRVSVSPTALALPQPVLPASAPSKSPLPDLYCIVLDAYGRQDVLQALFGIDNEPFLKALEQRGFFVARKSRANYLQTPLALAAALNLDYLPAFLPQGRSQEDASHLLDKSRTAALLRKEGFRYLSVPTGVVQTAIESADLTLDQFDGVVATLTPLDRLVIQKTPLAFLLVNENAAFDEHRARLLSALEKNLPAAAALPYPKFVFAHILAPHPPFVFGPNGEARIPDRAAFTIGDATDYGKRGSHEIYRKSYADQLTFLNQKVLESLDAIKKNQTRPAVIVLMGDHGSRMETDWKSLERTNLKEPFANLMAVATPDGGAGALLGDSVSSINVFRLLLTRYYNQNFPRLPDRSYYSTLEKPFALTDVTDKTD